MKKKLGHRSHATGKRYKFNRRGGTTWMDVWVDKMIRKYIKK